MNKHVLSALLFVTATAGTCGMEKGSFKDPEENPTLWLKYITTVKHETKDGNPAYLSEFILDDTEYDGYVWLSKQSGQQDPRYFLIIWNNSIDRRFDSAWGHTFPKKLYDHLQENIRSGCIKAAEINAQEYEKKDTE